MIMHTSNGAENRLLLIVTFVFISFGVVSVASAHEPRYVQDNQLVIIENPDISQAFYGELKGRTAYYLIDLPEAQELYFQILVPDLPGIQKDKNVTVEYTPALGQSALSFVKIDPDSAVWQNFYEEYAGDNYWQGPEVKKMGEAGYYIIKITSPNDTGKYVLVVGEKEEFPVQELAKALITIPQLKIKFFNKPIWQSLNGKIDKYFGLSLFILIVVGYLFRKFHQVYK